MPLVTLGCILFFNFLSSPEDVFSLLLEREKGREGGRNTDVREKHQSAASRPCPNRDRTRNIFFFFWYMVQWGQGTTEFFIKSFLASILTF